MIDQMDEESKLRGMEAAMGGMQSQDPAMEMGGEEESESPEMMDDFDSAIEAQLDSLSDEQKAFVKEHLTPEVVGMIGMIFGKETFNYLAQYANTESILIPVPRAQFEQQFSSQGQQPPANGQPMPQSMQQGMPQNTQPMAQVDTSQFQGMYGND